MAGQRRGPGPSGEGCEGTAQRRDCAPQRRACAEPPAWETPPGAGEWPRAPPIPEQWGRPGSDGGMGENDVVTIATSEGRAARGAA